MTAYLQLPASLNDRGTFVTPATYAVHDYVVSSANGFGYTCILAYPATGLSPDPSVDTTHWIRETGVGSNELAAPTGAASVGFLDQYVPAPGGPNYLKTVSDLLNGDEVSIFRFIDSTQISAMQSKTSSYDASADVATAIAALYDVTVGSGSGGGGLYIPESQILIQNVRVLPFVNLRGCGAYWNGFSNQGRGSVFKTVPGAAASAITGVTISNGGSGYSGSYSVSFSGSLGGAGAQGIAYFVGGVLVWIEVTDPGVGYAGTITLSLAGASPTVAATTTVTVSTALFFSSAQGGPNNADYCSFSGLGLQGLNDALHPDAGVILNNAIFFKMTDVQTYNFRQEAVKHSLGDQARLTNCDLFGLNRTGASPGTYYRSGAVYLNGEDSQIIGCNIGAAKSTDSTFLPNAALLLQAGAAGCRSIGNIYENSDAGMVCGGGNLQSVADRFELNGGHGFWLSRVNTSLGPPAGCSVSDSKASSNGSYVDNTYDNYHIDSGVQITGFRGRGLRSVGPGSGNKPRYGFYDGEALANGGGTVPNSVDGFYSDSNIGTAPYGGANSYVGPKNSLNVAVSGGSFISGTTVTADSNTLRLHNTQTGLTSSLTVNFPVGIGPAMLPFNDQEFYFSSDGPIATLSLVTTSPGITILNQVISMTAGQGIGYKFSSNLSRWYRIA